jgi:hypothetical protein
MTPPRRASLLATIVTGFAIGTYCDASAGAAAVDRVCEAPAELLQTRVVFERLARAVRTGEPIRIAVIGTGSSLGSGTSGANAAYPQRLAALLSRRWGGAPVTIVNASQSGQSAAAMAKRMPEVLREARPQLAIWQTATVDAMRGLDLNEFAAAIEAGIGAADVAGVDLLIVDAQYGGPLSTLADIAPYLDYLAQIVRGRNVALFQRFATMRYWAENGRLDLTSRKRADQQKTADRVHDCVAQALAAIVIDAID